MTAKPAKVPKLTPSTASCEVHRVHLPRSHVQEYHHVWPQALGGPTVPANMVWLCATGHNNVHRLMARLIATRGQLTAADRKGYARAEIALARLGYQRSIDRHL